VRELLVTDVYDVDADGKNRKPFARAFFTKDKSLIFYGFDLDKATGGNEYIGYIGVLRFTHRKNGRK